MQLPISTRAPRAEALLGYGRGDTLRLVERFSRRATTGRGHPGPQFHVYLLMVSHLTWGSRTGSYLTADGLTPPNGLLGP